MKLSVILAIVFIFLIIGIIFLVESMIHILIRKKFHPESVVLLPHVSADYIEYYLKKTIKKFPYSKIIIPCEGLDKETKKILKLLKRKYPYIELKNE